MPHLIYGDVVLKYSLTYFSSLCLFSVLFSDFNWHNCNKNSFNFAIVDPTFRRSEMNKEFSLWLIDKLIVG